MKNWKEELKIILQKYKEKDYFADAVLAVFNQRGLCFQACAGNALPESVFDIASLTKLFTTTSLLHALWKKNIQIDTKVLEFLEVPAEYEKLKGKLYHVTIRQLLTHTSGLPAWYPLYAGEGTLWNRLEYAVEREKAVDQGTMCYSDLGFILAGKIVENLLGQALPEIVETIIRKPLNIQTLMYLPLGTKLTEKSKSKIIISSYDNLIEQKMCSQRGISFNGFRPTGQAIQGEANDGNAWYYFNGISGHAGLFSDAAGVGALGRFYLNTDISLFNEALQNQGNNRGLGFEFGKRYPHGCGHTGFTGTSLFLSKELGVGGVLLTNRLANKEGKAPMIDECRIAAHNIIAENAAEITGL